MQASRKRIAGWTLTHPSRRRAPRRRPLLGVTPAASTWAPWWRQPWPGVPYFGLLPCETHSCPRAFLYYSLLSAGAQPGAGLPTWTTWAMTTRRRSPSSSRFQRPSAARGLGRRQPGLLGCAGLVVALREEQQQKGAEARVAVRKAIKADKNLVLVPGHHEHHCARPGPPCTAPPRVSPHLCRWEPERDPDDNAIVSSHCAEKPSYEIRHWPRDASTRSTCAGRHLKTFRPVALDTYKSLTSTLIPGTSSTSASAKAPCKASPPRRRSSDSEPSADSSTVTTEEADADRASAAVGAGRGLWSCAVAAAACSFASRSSSRPREGSLSALPMEASRGTRWKQNTASCQTPQAAWE